MKPGLIASKYNSWLCRLYTGAADLAERSPTGGRLMALPLSLGLFVTMPPVKVLAFLEEFTLVFVNLLGAAFSPRFSLRHAWLCLASSAQHLIGALLSPVTALFASIAVLTVLIISPRDAARRFAQTCRQHPTSNR